MTVRASVDVGIQDVSIRGWATFGHGTTSHLPSFFPGTLPFPLLVPLPSSRGSKTSQGDDGRIPLEQPMVLATPEQEMPCYSIAPQEKEETKCEIAEARGDETRDEPSDLPASTRLLFPQGWLSHRIEYLQMETERNRGFRRPEGAVDGPPKRRP